MERTGERKPKSYKLLFFLLIVLLAAGVILDLAASKGKDIQVPAEELPLYGAENQDQYDGWVRLTVDAITRIGTEKTSSTSKNIQLMETHWAVYVIRDPDGRQLVLRVPVWSQSDLSATREAYTGEETGFQLFGRLNGKVKTFFKDHEMAGLLKDYQDLDVITEYPAAQYNWQHSSVIRLDGGRYAVSVHVQNEAGKTQANAGIALAIVSVLALIVLVRKAKKQNRDRG